MPASSRCGSWSSSAARALGPGFGFCLGSIGMFASALVTGGVGPVAAVPDARRRVDRPGRGTAPARGGSPRARPAGGVLRGGLRRLRLPAQPVVLAVPHHRLGLPDRAVVRAGRAAWARTCSTGCSSTSPPRSASTSRAPPSPWRSCSWPGGRCWWRCAAPRAGRPSTPRSCSRPTRRPGVDRAQRGRRRRSDPLTPWRSSCSEPAQPTAGPTRGAAARRARGRGHGRGAHDDLRARRRPAARSTAARTPRARPTAPASASPTCAALLLTHAHPDHLAPEALLARSWARPSWSPARARTRGPRSTRAATGSARRRRDLRAAQGRRRSLEVGRVRRARPRGGARRRRRRARPRRACSSTSPRPTADACSTPPTPGRCRPRPSTPCATRPSTWCCSRRRSAPKVDHGTGHLDLATFPREVARLREVGAVARHAPTWWRCTSATTTRRGDELDRRLASWGARTVPDGTLLVAGGRRGPQHPRRCAACSSEARVPASRARPSAVCSPSRTSRYVATSGRREDDPEWLARVAGHRARRPAGWTTLETLEVADVLAAAGRRRRPCSSTASRSGSPGGSTPLGLWDAEPGSAARAESLAPGRARPRRAGRGGAGRDRAASCS